MFTIQFDHSAINLIMMGLSKLPYEQSANLIHGIQSEVRRQSDAAAEAAAAASASTAATVNPDGVEVPAATAAAAA